MVGIVATKEKFLEYECFTPTKHEFFELNLFSYKCLTYHNKYTLPRLILIFGQIHYTHHTLKTLNGENYHIIVHIPRKNSDTSFEDREIELDFNVTHRVAGNKQ